VRQNRHEAARASGGTSKLDGGRPTETLTIEQLAAQSGMTVRNIRAHRARGLLPAPEVHERVGYYGPEHLARLRLIQEMQGDGFNLRAIERLVARTRGDPERLLSLKHAVSAPFETEEPQVFTVAELREQFGEQADAQMLSLAVRLGVLNPLDDERYEAPVPSLLRAAEEVVARGVPLKHALTLVGKVREQCKAVAREFVRLFLDDLWRPFAREGYPQEHWPEVTESIDRLRPLSSQVLLAVYQLTMSRETEAAFGREIKTMTKRR
jgi:DNA-binding transcriptional MerR regulator